MQHQKVELTIDEQRSGGGAENRGKATNTRIREHVNISGRLTIHED